MAKSIAPLLAEEVGINAVRTIYTNDFEWVFRPQRIVDWGIDAYVETVEHEEPTGKLFALQIKSGPTYFRPTKGGYIYYGSERHLRYWSNYSLPVFLIIHNPETGAVLWQKVERENVTELPSGRWSIVIPDGNVLAPRFKQQFEAGIPSDERSARRFMMSVDYPIIVTCLRWSKLGTLKMSVNQHFKTINMRNAYISFPHRHPQPPDMEFSRWMVRSNLNEFMAFRFPWLDYEYEEPLDDSSGEGVVHRLLVNVNDLGKAIVTYEHYLEHDVEQKDIQPPDNEDELSDDEIDDLNFQYAIHKN